MKRNILKGAFWVLLSISTVSCSDFLDINPHDSHLENLDCGACHHGHKKPVLACDECHEFTNIKVP